MRRQPFSSSFSSSRLKPNPCPHHDGFGDLSFDLSPLLLRGYFLGGLFYFLSRFDARNATLLAPPYLCVILSRLACLSVSLMFAALSLDSGPWARPARLSQNNDILRPGGALSSFSLSVLSRSRFPFFSFSLLFVSCFTLPVGATQLLRTHNTYWQWTLPVFVIAELGQNRYFQEAASTNTVFSRAPAPYELFIRSTGYAPYPAAAPTSWINCNAQQALHPPSTNGSTAKVRIEDAWTWMAATTKPKAKAKRKKGRWDGLFVYATAHSAE